MLSWVCLLTTCVAHHAQGYNTVKYNDVIGKINGRLGPDYQYDRYSHASCVHDALPSLQTTCNTGQSLVNKKSYHSLQGLGGQRGCARTDDPVQAWRRS